MMLMNTHYFKNGWANDKSTTTWKPMSGGSAADAYHVYGVWWKDDHTIILYNNGVETAEITPGGAFDEPMYMFFDTEAFASWQGLPTIADLKDPSKNTMSVDWVRSWQLVPIGAKTKGGGK